MRRQHRRAPLRGDVGYEGRIRPSYIAASQSSANPETAVSYEGRIRPSYIAAGSCRGGRRRGRFYEGRIRPSYIAAVLVLGRTNFISYLRGANSPLLHCGRIYYDAASPAKTATRGEFAPPTLRQWSASCSLTHFSPTRGEFAPPTLRRLTPLYHPPPRSATRGEFAPPTLRRSARPPIPITFLCYEGRIRPSYIAAPRTGSRVLPCSSLRGANSPLLHCGFGIASTLVPVCVLRGANSPLLHCGGTPPRGFPGCSVATRGEFAPPTLRPDTCDAATAHDGTTRGEFAPPTLRRASRLSKPEDRLLRGANSPLLHCGNLPFGKQLSVPSPTRGEFAPPTLRQTRPRNPHRQRPSTRGEFAPPTLRRRGGRGCGRNFGATRGEFAPPTLRPERTGQTIFDLVPTRGEFAPPTLRHTSLFGDVNSRGATRGEFAPPTLRQCSNLESNQDL